MARLHCAERGTEESATAVFSVIRKNLRALGHLVSPGAQQVEWATKSLLLQYGHVRSRRDRIPVDRAGKPLPWYTYPAIEYLRSIDFSDKHVFEYGSGNSSLFWSSLAASVTSVEHNREWYELIEPKRPANHNLALVENSDEYVLGLCKTGRRFGVIVVDGECRHRCVAESIKFVTDDGLIILDNSDWFPNAAKALREADLIEVDFSGFGPVNQYTWTTSIFFKRTVHVRPRADRLPAYSVCALRQVHNEE